MTFKEMKEQILKDPAVKAEYEALAPEFEAVQAEIDKQKRDKIMVELKEG